jgi:hypothetical protein
MAKARPLGKAGRKAGAKSAKNGRQGSAQAKRPAVKRTAKPTRAAQGDRSAAGPVRKVAAGAATRLVERPVVTPEIPPPLPAPIASFTF